MFRARAGLMRRGSTARAISGYSVERAGTRLEPPARSMICGNSFREGPRPGLQKPALVDQSDGGRLEGTASPPTRGRPGAGITAGAPVARDQGLPQPERRQPRLSVEQPGSGRRDGWRKCAYLATGPVYSTQVVEG